MLSGESAYEHPITDESIDRLISTRNHTFAEQSENARRGVSNLIFQMLKTGPKHETISAETIAAIASNLADMIQVRSTTAPTSGPFTAGPLSEYKSATAVVKLRGLRTRLEEQTAALYVEEEKAASLANPDDAVILEQISDVFANARRRTKISWQIGMAMTITSFSIIVAMIVIAVGMSVLTGNTGWGLVFGGLSASTIIGTLIWRPYDRLFRATILAQQIEVIHIRIIAGLQGSNRGEQLRACEEAIEALRTVFREHDASPKDVKSSTRSRQMDQPDASR